MKSSHENLKIMIVAGEDSGDSHAAALVENLRAQLSPRKVEFFGAAGAKMRDAGVDAVAESDDFGIFGVLEVAKAVPMFLDVLKRLETSAVDRKADFIVLVDFPEFNLKLAKRLKKKGFTVVYYISPQLWAWRKYRIRGIRKYVDLLLTTLPFEADWYRERDVLHVAYVGNPLAGKVKASVKPTEFRNIHEIPPNSTIVALLPGSRSNEIKRNFPEMLGAARILSKQRDDLIFCVGLAPSRSETEIADLEGFAELERDGLLRVVKNETYDLLNAAEAAVVASGTATLEAAIMGTPQVIVYRSTSINYALIAPLVSVSDVGLANLIAGKRVFTELIQNDFNAESVAAEVGRLLEPAVNTSLRNEAASIKEKIGSGDASKSAAEEIIRFAGLD